MQYTPERDLLVLLLKQEYWDNYHEVVDLQSLKDNYKELWYIYKSLYTLKDNSKGDVSVEELQAWFFHDYPEADKELYTGLFKTLSETKISEDVGVALLKSIKARQAALKLSEAAFRYSSGNGELGTVINAYAALDSVPETTEDFKFVSTDLEQLIKNTVQQHGLRWRLDFLNKSLGSLRRGNFGFIYARPETGKTTFLASEITQMLHDLPEDAGPIIWFNNEQPGEDVMMRIYMAYFGVRLEQLMSNPAKYRSERVRSHFLLVDDAQLSKSQVEKHLKHLKPSLVVYDQIDKIKGFAEDREDLRLGSIYIWARELAKEYCPAIGVCQADGSAENQKWLTMDMVANAKTAKQAEADWILGIGKIHAEGAENIRYFNICKNKLFGDMDSLPHLRHGRSEIYIEPDIGRYKDIVKYD